MKEREAVPELVGTIAKHRQVLGRMHTFYADFRKKHPAWDSLDTEAAMAIAQFYSNYYTCIETVFFRISSFFENHLEKSRWHSHLLDRMTLDIPGQRPRVIMDDTHSALSDLLKFRHFTRYYFDFDYDRDKLAFLGIKFEKTRENVNRDLTAFEEYLDKISH